VRIARDRVVYRLDADAPFVARLPIGTRVTIETHDCRTGTITEASTVDDLRDTSFVNPVTGPIEVEGVTPGDVLAIDIDRVATMPNGLMIHRPGTSAIDTFPDPILRVLHGNDTSIDLGPVRVPRSPMIGFIGLTPATEKPKTLLGGRYGGNMDTNLLQAGARLYLPVDVPGAGLHVGDLHAAMGDGEVFMTGVEVGGEVDLTVHRLDRTSIGDRSVPFPLLETERLIVPIAAGQTLDAAARAALDAGMTILTSWIGLDPTDAGFFLSAACDLRISQFLPGLGIHARLEIPKQPLVEAGRYRPLLDTPLPAAGDIGPA
jgi:amidase